MRKITINCITLDLKTQTQVTKTFNLEDDNPVHLCRELFGLNIDEIFDSLCDDTRFMAVVKDFSYHYWNNTLPAFYDSYDGPPLRILSFTPADENDIHDITDIEYFRDSQ